MTVSGSDLDTARLLVRLDAFTNITVTTVTADQQRHFRHAPVSLSTQKSMIEEPTINISTI
jgi:hypothetical protein